MLTAQRTDAGRIRLINEDRAAVRHDLNGFTLAIVADGMGGHQAGEIASQMAIELIQSRLQTVHARMTVEQCKDAVRDAILSANDKVFEFASDQARYQGMGTTVVVALAARHGLVIGHIGDSRAYLMADGSIRQLTEDHSLVNELIKSGQITPDEANVHPLRNVVTRALGTEKQVDVDVDYVTWSRGSILLLCSDGLSGLVEEETLVEVLNERKDLEWKVDRLVEHALEAGGGDNITAVLLENDEAVEANGEERGDDA